MEWIIQNREWVFSGIGVAILLLVINLLQQKRRNKTRQTKGDFIQINSGSGDNVGRDKITKINKEK